MFWFLDGWCRILILIVRKFTECSSGCFFWGERRVLLGAGLFRKFGIEVYHFKSGVMVFRGFRGGGRLGKVTNALQKCTKTARLLLNLWLSGGPVSSNRLILRSDLTNVSDGYRIIRFLAKQFLARSG